MLCRDGTEARRVARGYVLVNSFAVGYVIEEQARLQAPDDRYDPRRRQARLGTDDDLGLSEFAMATGDDRFEDLLTSIIETVRRDLGADRDPRV